MTSKRVLGILTSLQVLAVAQLGWAQDPVPFGARIRFATDSSSGLVVGTLISADPDSLQLTTAKETRAMVVRTSSLVRFERSRGLKPATGHGAVIGGLVGVLTGLALGVAASAEEDNGCCYEVGGAEIAGASAVLGLFGAGIGALIGSASHREKWEPVPIPGRN